MDLLRHHVLLVLMPVFFLSTGLRTAWTWAAPRVPGRRSAAGRRGRPASWSACSSPGVMLGWLPGEAGLIGWLLQTKALIMIIFVNILLDKGSSATPPSPPCC